MSDNGQKVIEAVREVAAATPHRVYMGQCTYVVTEQQDDGNFDCVPGCLVGQGLCKAGIITDLDKFRNREENGFSIAAVVGIHRDWGLDPDEVAWLSTVQSEQDAERPWGRAVLAADNPDITYGVATNIDKWWVNLKQHHIID
jgi:hypothetical protein